MTPTPTLPSQAMRSSQSRGCARGAQSSNPWLSALCAPIRVIESLAVAPQRTPGWVGPTGPASASRPAAWEAPHVRSLIRAAMAPGHELGSRGHGSRPAWRRAPPAGGGWALVPALAALVPAPEWRRDQFALWSAWASLAQNIQGAPTPRVRTGRPSAPLPFPPATGPTACRAPAARLPTATPGRAQRCQAPASQVVGCTRGG